MLLGTGEGLDLTCLDLDREDVWHDVLLYRLDGMEWVGAWVGGANLYQGGFVRTDAQLHQSVLIVHCRT